MAHTVHGLLRKPPFIKQLESSTMFIVELSEMIKDYQTQEKTYTNYKAMLFAKSDAAIAYYNKAFAEGSFVVVSCEKLKVDKFDADNGTTYITLMMDNARLEGAKFDDVNDGNWGQPQQPAVQPQQQQNYAPQQQAPQQQQYSQRNPQQMPSQAQREAQQRQQAQPQYNEPPQDFDTDIPF